MGGGGVHERESEREIMESTDLHHTKQSLKSKNYFNLQFVPSEANY